MSNCSFTHGSLFSGIGGFDLAAEWMGWENIFHCEWNAFGQKVLKHYWPNAISYEDITKTDFTIHRGGIDILTGGFPCQPYSAAGKRLGKEDDRHLWPEMLRAIREIQPMYVVGENVRGLTNWNGGMVFDEVQADLEAQGYEVLPFLLPACAVNAPHRRDRIWFVAYSFNNRHSAIGGKISKENRVSRINREKMESREFNRTNLSRNASYTDSDGFNQCDSNDEINPSKKGEYALGDINKSNGDGDVTDTNNKRLQARSITERNDQKGRKEQSRPIKQSTSNARKTYSTNWRNFPTTEPTIRTRNDGLSDRLDSITFPKWRNESIKAGGNAIVPQVAYQIFKAISQ